MSMSRAHNQLTMELMRKIAKKHDMLCLLHEKPFAGVNGSANCLYSKRINVCSR